MDLLKTRSVAQDVLIVAAIAAIIYGFSLIYEPLGWILGGSIVLWLAVPTRTKSGG